VDEAMRLNPGRQLVRGQQYEITVQGKPSLGWRYEGLYADGKARFSKINGLSKEVSVEELASELNPVKIQDKSVLVSEQAEPVLIPFENGKYRTGTQVSYKNEDFTIAKYDSRTGRPILYKAERGEGWAFQVLSLSSEEFRQYRPIVGDGGKALFVNPQSTAVYEMYPLPAHDGKIRLVQSRNYVIVDDVKNLKVATTR